MAWESRDALKCLKVPPRHSTAASGVALSVGTSAHGSRCTTAVVPTQQVRWQPGAALPILQEHVWWNRK
eukprot:358620-Lingulodinium_polyedra.AAC.1